MTTVARNLIWMRLRSKHCGASRRSWMLRSPLQRVSLNPSPSLEPKPEAGGNML